MTFCTRLQTLSMLQLLMTQVTNFPAFCASDTTHNREGGELSWYLVFRHLPGSR